VLLKREKLSMKLDRDEGEAGEEQRGVSVGEKRVCVIGEI